MFILYLFLHSCVVVKASSRKIRLLTVVGKYPVAKNIIVSSAQSPYFSQLFAVTQLSLTGPNHAPMHPKWNRAFLSRSLYSMVFMTHSS